MKTSEKLLAWYRANKRSLPWRQSRDPYRIWISEIMLQQTTVTAVIPYYEKFLTAFPNVESLAKAREEKVLSLWSGLGYYSRARNLQKAAKAIVALGYFPRTYNELIELSGIGPYTAAAIASIAFDEEVAAIDGNVIRVLSRIFDIPGDLQSKNTKLEIQKRAVEMIKYQPPSEHNQAMMELGATICMPKNPACLLCPVTKDCQARLANTIGQRPAKKIRRKPEPWLWTMYFSKDKGKLALTKTENGTPWLKNTWVFPGLAQPLDPKKIPKAPAFKHCITHHQIFVEIQKMKPKDLSRKFKNLKWINSRDIHKLGVSSIVEKALRAISAQE